MNEPINTTNPSSSNPFSAAPAGRQPKMGMKIVSIILFGAVIFGLGWTAAGGKLSFADGHVKVDRAYDPNKADYSLFWETYDLLNSKFVDRPLDQQKLLHGAIAGLVAAAGDPYTTFFDPEQAQEFASELQGSFDGIGAEIGLKDNHMVIISPLDDSPAQKAGLLPGDAILAVDGESTQNMTVDQAVTKIRGKAGTDVKLTIQHTGKTDSTDVTIKRDKITINSVKYETKDVDGKKIAIIKISRFSDDTKGLLDHAVDSLLQAGVKGIVLDLRSDPGGYLETAITTASNWVNNGEVVVQEKHFDSSITDYKSEVWPRLKGIKTVVLVNGGSASASEIVAGALQDHGLAQLVGQKTFGKGSVQELTDLKDGSTVKITIAKWLTPNGRSIDKNGLEPDVKVDLTQADVDAGKDPQMDKALELVK